jgi:nucleoside 2-deoxyribosyltransferase
MLNIVGGTYYEHCSEPHWSQLFGSGLRAAAALSDLSDRIELHTYVGEQDVPSVGAHTTTWKIATDALHTIHIPQTLTFFYFHALSIPHISPPIGLITPATSHTVDAEYILRFGMLEGDGVVNGRRVVYDPQSALNPKPFTENGSRAEHLAIVANRREAMMLTREHSLHNMGRILLEQSSADVVVIKRGPVGATVITPEEITTVPAFRVDNVWPLGSGDVFAAVFAHFWAEQNVSPVDAAYMASLATAYYCNTQSLPITAEIFIKEPFQPVSVVLDSNHEVISKAQIYLAGPFFTMAQRWLVEEARTALRSQNLRIFSPFHDVGHGLADDVVPADINALDRSTSVFAIMDGLDPGTIFEVGYARAKGIAVTAFVQNESEENMKMLVGTNCLVLRDFVSAIYNAVWQAFASS